MNIQYEQIWVSFRYAVMSVPVTLLLTVVPLLVGIIFGTGVAAVRVYRVKIISTIFDFMIAVLKGIPLTLIILMISLVFTNTFDSLAGVMNWPIKAKDIPVVFVALFAISVSAVTMISETIRGALLSVGKGQYEAGYSVGLTTFQTFRRIIAPQAFLVLLPSLSGNMIGLLKGSSIAFLIGVSEVLNSSLKTATSTYCFLEAYIAAAIIYWGLGIAIEYLGKILEKKAGCYRRDVV